MSETKNETSSLKPKSRFRRAAALFVLLVFLLLLAMLLAQRFWAHRNGYFKPDYPRVALTEDSDYETIFLQTGLGRAAVDKLLADGNFQAVLDAQEAFFNPPEGSCEPLLGWFTREDRLAEPGPPLADLQPGDVVLTLSTHSLGWRHGHAGLALDEANTLECVVLGTDSVINSAAHWNRYTNYVVLRLKDADAAFRRQIADYANAELLGIPYHLTAGFIGPKAPDPDDWQFGLQCSYLVWYAYNHFGIDLDFDGGRLVSCYDLLHADRLEIVQLYGMDPRPFADAA